MEQKILVKELGPDRPDVVIRQQTKERNKVYSRNFCRSWFERKPWLTGCGISNALFCFPCILFKSDKCDLAWTQSGQTDLKHLSDRIKKHERSRLHMENCIKVAVLGKMSIATQLDDGHRFAVRRHNEEVDKNRHILSKLIDCIKFCGAFELALRGHEESETPENPGIFRGLVDLMASIDRDFNNHLENATVFRGAFKTVQNELLDCMLESLKEKILDEVRTADFLAIQADGTTDISTDCQLVLVLRYIDRTHNIQERFYEFIKLSNANTDGIAGALLERLRTILPEGQEKKLIAQAYDGSSVMRGAEGVHQKVQDTYENAYYVHCYAHQLNLVMQQATSHIPEISHFFSDIGGFSSFFSKSSNRTAVLDEVVAHRLPGASATCWNFSSNVVNTVYEHKADLVKCFEIIRNRADFDGPTKREAGSYVRILEDDAFCFFLALFHKIMPHMDMLYKQLQKTDIDSAYISEILQRFIRSMQAIRDNVPSLVEGQEDSGSVEEPPSKKRRTLGEDKQNYLALEVCDTIMCHAKERFSFTKHLVSATLLQGDLFPQHDKYFPNAALDTTVEAYPSLEKARLKTELSLIYSSKEFQRCCGAMALYQVLMKNGLQDAFTETVSLLKILITTPMMTSESERCFSTLKRIKTFLRNTMAQDRLNALAMLSIEKNLTRDIPEFNTKVIEKFATQKDRQAKFMYK